MGLCIVDIHGEIEGDYDIIGKYEKPKTGHWKRISIDKYVQHAMAYYKCSVCDKDIIGTHNYCPNCGCRMVEPQESEDKE